MVRKEGEKNNAQNNSQKPNFLVLVQSEVPRAINSPWHAFQGSVHLVGPAALQRPPC